MVNRVAKHRRLKKNIIIVAAVVVICAAAVLLRNNTKNEPKKIEPSVQFDDVIVRGFEAFSSNDLYNAELIFSSFFDKKGNDLNAFNKIKYNQQLLTRSLYGSILFRKKNLEKAEAILSPIFKDEHTINRFVSVGVPEDEVLLSYITILKIHKNLQKMQQIFNFFYSENGNATEILRKFGDISSLRATAGEVFFINNEYKRVITLLEPFFKDSKLLSELTVKQQAISRWHYGHSLICEDKEDRAKEVFSPFFDENFKPTQLFEILNKENQIICRTQYAQILLSEDNFEKVVKLLEGFFDNNGDFLPQFKDSLFQDIIRSVYAQTLVKLNRFYEANKVLRWFFYQEKSIKNLDQDEINSLKSLYTNINRMWVRNW